MNNPGDHVNQSITCQDDCLDQCYGLSDTDFVIYKASPPVWLSSPQKNFPNYFFQINLKLLILLYIKIIWSQVPFSFLFLILFSFSLRSISANLIQLYVTGSGDPRELMWDVLNLCCRNKTGILGWRSEKTETVNGYEAKVEHRLFDS